MTYEHDWHVEPGWGLDAGSTSDPGETLHPIRTYFSPFSLMLMGSELTHEVVAWRDVLQVVTSCKDRFAERFNDAVVPDSNGTVRRLFKESPSAADLCHKINEDFDEFISLRSVNPPHDLKALHESAHRLYIGYSHYKFIAPALAAEAVEADIASEELYYTETLDFHQRSTLLFRGYAGTNSVEPVALLEQLTQDIIQYPFRSSDRHIIGEFLVAERIAGTFERLEQEEDNKQTVVLSRFIKESLTGGQSRPIGERPGSRFLPPSVVQKCQKRWLSLDEPSKPSVDVLVSDLVTSYADLIREKHHMVVTECVQSGLKALRQAERSVISLPPNETGYFFITACDLESFPFSMIERGSKTAVQDAQALEFLIPASDLSRVRSEIGQLFNSIDGPRKREMGSEWQREWQRALREAEWRERVQTAQETVANLIHNHLTAVMESARPLQRVVSGQLHVKKQPGSAKQPSNRTPKKVYNALHWELDRTPKGIYDALHREGVFENVEKAVITAIACGDWPTLQQAGSKVVDIYNRIVLFAADKNCVAGLDTHPIQKIVSFSPDTVYSQIHQKISKQGRKILDPLRPAERELLEAVLREWQAQDPQTPSSDHRRW